MIFNSNTTSLNTSNVVMAEGYDCSYGPALALVEAAEMDYKMFCAMLNVDAYEMQVRRESAGYVAESQIVSIAEATISSIWESIVKFFKSLAEKLKAMFSTAWAKMSQMWTNDKKLVEKYKAVAEKAPGTVKIKWVAYKSSPIVDNYALDPDNNYSDDTGWADNKEDRVKYFLGSTLKEFTKAQNTLYIGKDDAKPSETTIDGVGGIAGIISYLSDYATKYKTYSVKCNKLVATAKSYSDAAKKNIKAEKNLNSATNKGNEDGVTTAKKAYDMAQAYHDAIMAIIKYGNGAIKQEYKQNKAAFMKAVSAGNKPAEAKNEAYLDAIGEAAEQEVDDIIDSTISKEKFDDLNKAGLDITDSGVSNDPDALVYAPDKYTDDLYGTKVGTIDTEINSKEESAFFSQLFY